MTRPQTVQEMLEALARLVEPTRLAAFAAGPAPTDVPGALAALVADGLLTPFQAAEVASGNGDALRLGGYRVLDRIGRGGTGSVFLAEHAMLGKRVAVKVLSDALRADPEARRRFVGEARAAAALAHPNIVTVLGADMSHDPPFLVMEYVDGLSLQEVVARGGALGSGEVAAVAVQLAAGLGRAAAVGLVHRDIKPANVLIDRRGAVKILDFGIVKFTHDAHSHAHGADVILGTLDYLAPEQAVDYSSVDARADLYALGATLYFLLTGHPPFPGRDVQWKLRVKQTGDPHPLHQLRPDLPSEMVAAVHKLLARDRADRFQTAAAAADAFRPWVTVGEDFPYRLFRLEPRSTVHDHGPADPEPGEALPDTLRIVKTGPRDRTKPSPALPATPPAPPPEEAEPAPALAFDPPGAARTVTRRSARLAFAIGLAVGLFAALAAVTVLALVGGR